MTSLNTQINIGGDNFAARNVTQGFNYQGNIGSATDSFAHGNLANPQPPTLARDPDDGFPYLTFVIDTVGFSPGETLLFTGADKHPNSEYVNTTVTNISNNFSNHNLLVNENEGNLGFFYLRANESAMVGLPAESGDPVPETQPGDILQTAFYFRDTFTNSPLGAGQIEPSLSSKLYLYNGPGDVELLEFIDFFEAGAEYRVDWRHFDRPGGEISPVFQYRSLSAILDDPFQADYQRGHGYFFNTMITNSAANRRRQLARYNLAASEKREAIPFSQNARMYTNAIPTRNWFNDTPFPLEIPKEDNASYLNLNLNGYDRPGGFGLFRPQGTIDHGTIYPLYDHVRAETGLLSLGFLKNVNFAQRFWQPTFSFGNSEAHTHVARNAVQEVHAGTSYFDLTYLLNESLWDRFFLSTIPQTGGLTPSSGVVLPNTSHRLVPRADGTFPAIADLRASSTAFQTAAASVAVQGGFNVNSTSVDAWRMFLSSHLGESVTTADGEPSNDTSRVPFAGKVYPLISEAGNPVASSSEVWTALRSLSGDEIDALAVAMVEEVKRRGPFLSLADFVNRRLVPDSSDLEADYLGLKGTLQAAIDKVTAGGAVPLNAPFQQGDLALSASSIGGGNARYPEHETGSPEGVIGSSMFGVPGYLTQADILSSLGSALTVRGDTFTIRAYGESMKGITGEVDARAWCEVVVQRVAEPVEEGDSIVRPSGRFGRSFKILSLRWLTDDDII
ncbi:MAG: hypothetical protein EA353_00175 [Puniceicoccaceae bacterium]|nr:MAG: hypothetical protein EA353_00175 [Puniceicoccaceae bacterium]